MSAEQAAAADAGTPDAVTAAFADWRQADVIGGDLLLMWLADRGLTLTAEATAAAAADDGDERDVLVAVRPEAFVVLTQTCDLVRDSTVRSSVQLAPLVRLPAETAAGARRGHVPRYAHLPELGDDAFADLDYVMTAEKARIVDCQRRHGVADDTQRRTFARAVARKFERFAFPDGFTTTVAPFTSRVRRRHDKAASPEGAAFQQVAQVRAEAPDWEADDLSVNLVFILPVGQLAPEAAPRLEDERWLDGHTGQPPPADIAQRLAQCPAATPPARWLWELLAEAWVGACDLHAPVASLTPEVHSADEMTVQRYWASVELDLDYLSDAAPSPPR